jgi:hypothetical protein
MNRTLRMAVFNLVLGTLPVLDVVVFVLHDPVDAARRSVLAVVVEATSELPLLAFVVTSVDVAASVVTTPVLVEVGAYEGPIRRRERGGVNGS